MPLKRLFSVKKCIDNRIESKTREKKTIKVGIPHKTPYITKSFLAKRAKKT